MTDQERDLLRIAAWDRYQSAKIDFLAHKRNLQKFHEPMRLITDKLLCDLLEITEQEALAFPERGTFISAFREFKTVVREYEVALDEARKFNWPVPPADEPYSLCHPRAGSLR